MKEKLLTIVIPVFKTEEYLPKCINSLIIPQQMQDIEVLIIIDGSPDNSYQVAIEYQRKYPESIKVINKENGGHGSVINRGLELATGKYFKVLDSDDWFDTDLFALFVSKLNVATADVILTNYSREYVYEHRSNVVKLDNFPYDVLIDANSFDYTNYGEDQIMCLAKIAYKTSLLKNMNLRLQENSFYDDVEYQLLPFSFVKTIEAYDIILYKYFIGRPGQSVSNTIMLRNLSHHMNIVKKCLMFLGDNKLDLGNKLIYIDKDLSGKVDGSYIKSFYLPWKESYIKLKDFDGFVFNYSNHFLKESYYLKERKKMPFFLFFFLRKLYLSLKLSLKSGIN